MAASDPATGGNLLYLLFGSSGLAFIAGVYKMVKDFNDSRGRRQSSTLTDLEKWRRKESDAREWSEAQLSWYRDWAGRLEYTVTSSGIPLPQRDSYPIKPPDPEDQP